MPNRLSGEKSPYLLQHAENPVDWYPWGTEALSGPPHWTSPSSSAWGTPPATGATLWAHESFEDAAVAEALNRDFISIKVDREERPDVDAVTWRPAWP